VYTNWVEEIQGRTNIWNLATNIPGLLNSTNYWNGGGSASARVTQLEARTNAWNSAYTNLNSISNRFYQLENKTNNWDTAYSLAVSNNVHAVRLDQIDSNTTFTITGSVVYAVYQTGDTNSIHYFECVNVDQHFYPLTTNIYVQMWAGGGAGNNMNGGGAAYISGYMSVTQGETLVVTVGAGGNLILTPKTSGHPVYGGGGGASYGGEGGGRSAIRRGFTDLVTAGAGGGAGLYYPSCDHCYSDFAGGPGGIASGTNGAGSGMGYGGGQMAGGAGNEPGGFNYGGDALIKGGGGGAGYYGGGAGTFGVDREYDYGAGGGSSLTSGFYLLGTCQGGNGRVPGGLGAQYYVSDRGYGGFTTDSQGRPGRIVIREEPYVDPTWTQIAPTLGYNATVMINTNNNKNYIYITTTNGVATDFLVFYRD
jgi:hypothetical protein